MKKILLLLIIPGYLYAQDIPLFQEFTFNQPEVRVKQEVYLGDKMLEQSTGSYKPCIVPKVTKVARKRQYSIEYRANEALCKMKENNRDYIPQYNNYISRTGDMSLPVRMSGSGNNITLKYCQLGLCAGKQKYNSTELEVSDRFFTVSPNTFQQSILECLFNNHSLSSC